MVSCWPNLWVKSHWCSWPCARGSVNALQSINRTGLLPKTIQMDSGFDLFRLSKSKEVVDVCSNTLREYNRQGLPFYHRGKAIFVSKTELAQFIMYAPWDSDELENEET